MGPIVWELDGPGPHLKRSKIEVSMAGRKGCAYEASGVVGMKAPTFLQALGHNGPLRKSARGRAALCTAGGDRLQSPLRPDTAIMYNGHMRHE